jgi:uncharacterized protein (TIGR03083 family)
MSLETVDDARRVARLSRAEYEDLLGYLEKLPPAGWTEQSACSEWQVYQVVSHIGSQPEIHAGTLNAGLRGAPPMTDDDRKAIWARFDAMQPDEVLPAFKANNDAFVALVDSLSEEELGKTIPWIFGPTPLASVLAGRLNEQALHNWDVKRVHDTRVKVTAAAVPDLLEVNVPSRVGRLAQPARAEALVGKTIQFLYSQPDGAVSVSVEADGAQATPGNAEAPDLTVELPAEALIRLIWGRYDVAGGVASGELKLSDPALADALQRLFPGR